VHLYFKCRLSYGARWQVGDRCPNLIPTEQERARFALKGPTFAVNHTNYQSNFALVTPYESLAEMWSSFNTDYLNADFPRLIIRMEDTIFYPRQVLELVANCSGMPLRQPFEYSAHRGKRESDTDLVTAMMKYGNDAGRVYSNLTREEKRYLQTALDPQLMQLLHYRPLQEEEIR